MLALLTDDRSVIYGRKNKKSYTLAVNFGDYMNGWKDIQGYEGYYQINKEGQVYSFKRKGTEGRIKKPRLNNSGYLSYLLYKNGSSKSFLVHRLVFITFTKCIDDGYEIDHIDGDKTNNKLYNLRVVTKYQNSMNRKPNVKNKTSKYKGVYYHRRDKKWKVQIGINKKKKWIGEFIIEKDAAKAYDRAALSLFGEYALTNKKLGLL